MTSSIALKYQSRREQHKDEAEPCVWGSKLVDFLRYFSAPNFSANMSFTIVVAEKVVLSKSQPQHLRPSARTAEPFGPAMLLW